MTNDEQSASVQPTSPHDETARKFYAALLKRASTEDVAGAELPVFRGYLTEVFVNEIGTYGKYTACKQLLDYNRVIEVVERGFRKTPAMVILFPLPDYLEPVPKAPSQKDLTASEEFASLRDRVKRLEDLVGNDHLPSVLQELAQRLPETG